MFELDDFEMQEIDMEEARENKICGNCTFCEMSEDGTPYCLILPYLISKNTPACADFISK